MQRSTAPLTPAMVELVKDTEPGQVAKPGSTRTALIRRGMVHPRESAGMFGTLTDSGLQARAKMLPAAQAGMGEATANQATRIVDALHAEALTEASELALAAPAAPVVPLLGQTLRSVLEADVRLARTIPDGRRRHGQTKARRDALRHARKLELAGV